jgi:hypothetical protein
MLSLLLLLPFTLLGTDLEIARLTLLTICFISLAYLAKDSVISNIILPFALITLLQYHVFQFSHLSVSEMFACMCMVMSMKFLIGHCTTVRGSKKTLNLILASFFIAIAIFLKVQYVYAALIIPAVFTVIIARRYFQTKTFPREDAMNFMVFSACLTVWGLLYFFLILLPFKPAVEFMITDDVIGRYPEFTEYWLSPVIELTHLTITSFIDFFLHGLMLPFTLLFAMSLIAGSWLITQKTDKTFKLIITFSLIWFCLEIHKLSIMWVPTRYLIGMIISMGIFTSVIIAELMKQYGADAIRTHNPKRMRTKRLLIGLYFATVLITVGNNIKNLGNSYMNRSSEMEEINNYVKNANIDNHIVLGEWGPAITWKSNAHVIPRRKEQIDIQDLKYYRPALAVIEYRDYEASSVYGTMRLDLYEHADSVRKFRVNDQYNLELFWINDNTLDR